MVYVEDPATDRQRSQRAKEPLREDTEYMARAPITFTDKEADANGFVTVAQVAKKLGYSTSKVYKLIEAKLLLAYTDDTSDRQTKRLTPADVYDYVKVHFTPNFRRVR